MNNRYILCFLTLCIAAILTSSCHRNVPVSVVEAFDTLSLPNSDSVPNPLPDGFVYVADVVSDVIEDIRYCGTYNFVGTRIDGYEAPVAISTREAALALKNAADFLREHGYRLKIYDAYRPQQAVDHFVRWAQDISDTLMRRHFYPDLNKSSLFPLGYIAQKSSHTRGSTFDLTLFCMDSEQDEDMGGTFDWFGASSAMYYQGISHIQQEHRRILRDAMRRAGFRSISGEWWHYTLINEPYPDTYFNFPVK